MNDLTDRFDQGELLGLNTVDRAAETVSVVNPWNPPKPPPELTFEAMQEAVIGVEINAAAG